MKKFVLLCTTAVLPSAAFAQSTGTTTFENETIVVTGNRTQDVGGVKVTDTTKARNILTQEFIARQQPGQSIDDIINYLPGVNFQSNGPYGDAGGTLTIHGFDASRISQTFDGVPMNDSGNYALYSQEQLDPELISEVNVSVGSTDLDSPTASATGGTVNYVLRDPMKDMHGRIQGSIGSFGFKRFFGVFDTGAFTPSGTRAFVAASNQRDYNPYDPSSKINKSQFNAKVFQPLGGDDFVSLNAFYTRNRGDKFNDLTLDKFPTSSSTSVLTPPPCTTTRAIAGHNVVRRLLRVRPQSRRHLSTAPQLAVDHRARTSSDTRAELRVHRSERRRRHDRNRRLLQPAQRERDDSDLRLHRRQAVFRRRGSQR